MKKAIIKRIFLGILGLVSGLLAAYLQTKNVPEEVVSWVVGGLATLGAWGLSAWLGGDIKDFQRKLNNALPDEQEIPVDGLFGPVTEKAATTAINDRHVTVPVKRAKLVNEPRVLDAKRNLKGKL